MAIRILCPYPGDSLPWLRGNLHAHTSKSDGECAVQEVIDAYAGRGYDFLCISDHDMRVDLSPYDPRGMTLIHGNEITSNGPHIVHVDAGSVVPPLPDRQTVLTRIEKDRGFAIVPHPNWEEDYSHCPQALLENWTGYAGIEVYNGIVRRLEGSPLATDRWDRLLGAGLRVWGFADDDSHRIDDIAIAWNVVQCESRSASAIVDALRRGSFYASTGVRIRAIRVQGRAIQVDTENAERIIVHSDFGHREAAFDGQCAEYTVPEDAGMAYVRFECWGRGDDMGWTQPFFIESV